MALWERIKLTCVTNIEIDHGHSLKKKWRKKGSSAEIERKREKQTEKDKRDNILILDKIQRK